MDPPPEKKNPPLILYPYSFDRLLLICWLFFRCRCLRVFLSYSFYTFFVCVCVRVCFFSLRFLMMNVACPCMCALGFFCVFGPSSLPHSPNLICSRFNGGGALFFSVLAWNKLTDNTTTTKLLLLFWSFFFVRCQRTCNFKSSNSQGRKYARSLLIAPYMYRPPKDVVLVLKTRLEFQSLRPNHRLCVDIDILQDLRRF